MRVHDADLLSAKLVHVLKDLLTGNALSNSSREVASIRGRRDFLEFVGKDQFLAAALGTMVERRPWSYWDPQVVRIALRTLEANIDRSLDSIAAHLEATNVGVSEWLREMPAGKDEDAIGFPTTKDLVRLVSTHHPEYLRRAEHIFGNVVRLYWGVAKNKGVGGSFGVKAALALLASKNLGDLSKGYVEAIRNAVAHGEVVFTGIGIKYGAGPDAEMSASDFLHELDSLWETCNSLLLALVIFLCRVRQLGRRCEIPFRLAVFFADVSASYPGFRIEDVVESNYPVTGRQLHLTLRSPFLSRNLCKLDCCRISMYLLELGASGFKRFVFQIHQSRKPISSSLIVDAVALGRLLDESAPSSRISEAFQKEAEMLWYDEGRMAVRIRVGLMLIKSHWKLHRSLNNVRMRAIGVVQVRSRYEIRSVEDRSAGRCIRLQVRACLADERDSNDREVIREILRSIVRVVRNQWYWPKADGLSRTVPLWGRPAYVWVSLYRHDKPIRAFNRNGRCDPNLLAEAERVYGYSNSPILIKDPQEILEKLRIRYDFNLPIY